MKPVVLLLLAVSLVANAAFIGSRLMNSSPTTAEAETLAADSSRSGATSASTKSSGSAGRTDVIAALKANNLEALRDVLREAGLPDETVRLIVSSALWTNYSERMKALQPKPDPDTPWWKNADGWYGNNMTREQRAEMRRLQREANDEVTRLLGPDKDQQSRGWQDPRLAFLPEAKRKDLQEIEQDYQELIHEVQQEMQGFTLPSDAEKIRFLQEEKKRDLAGILTPEELADYDLRMSPTAQQLRWKMTRFDGTEEEYRKVFAIQQAYDATQQLDSWGNPIGNSPGDWKKRQEAQKQLNEQFKVALGEERYADYIRSQNHEYQQLAAATKRLSLPPETATQVFNLRHDIAAESKRIADNSNLTNEQKKAELVALAAKTRDQIRARLGEEGAEVYMKNGMNWLQNVEDGRIVTFSETGQHTGSTNLPREPKKTTPKP